MLQEGTISGGIYKVYSTASQDYKRNRMPRVGQKVELGDGSKFVFCSTAVDIAAGQAVEAQAVVEETTIDVANVINETVVEVSQAGIAVGDWKDGTLVVVLGTGVGYRYPISKNTATDTDGDVLITLSEPLQTALATTDDVTIVPNRSRKVVIGTEDGDIVGVAAAPSTAAANSRTEFLWVQTQGVAYGQTCTVTAGQPIQPAAAGAWAALAADTDPNYGYSVEPGATNGVIMLKCQH